MANIMGLNLQVPLSQIKGIPPRFLKRLEKLKIFPEESLIKRGHKTLLVGGRLGIAQKAANTIRTVLVGKPTRTVLEGKMD